MTVTWCLGGFAQRIEVLPRKAWKAEVEAMPERCPHGCVTDCRKVCAEYARMQWRLAAANERKKA